MSCVEVDGDGGGGGGPIDDGETRSSLGVWFDDTDAVSVSTHVDAADVMGDLMGCTEGAVAAADVCGASGCPWKI